MAAILSRPQRVKNEEASDAQQMLMQYGRPILILNEDFFMAQLYKFQQIIVKGSWINKRDSCSNNRGLPYHASKFEFNTSFHYTNSPISQLFFP